MLLCIKYNKSEQCSAILHVMSHFCCVVDIMLSNECWTKMTKIKYYLDHLIKSTFRKYFVHMYRKKKKDISKYYYIIFFCFFLCLQTKYGHLIEYHFKGIKYEIR